MPSITSANAVIMFTIPGLFPIPQQLQGFSADDIYTVDATAPAITLMGLDGVLSGGYVPRPKLQTFVLQADSPSISLFEAWEAAQDAALDVFPAGAIVLLKSNGREYTCIKGFLTQYSPAPDARQTLQPRRFQVTWQNLVGAAV